MKISTKLKRSLLRILFSTPAREKKWLNPNLFASLQNQYSPRDGYKYDYNSRFVRSAQRASKVVDIAIKQGADPRGFIEVGCGDGLLSKVLSDNGFSVLGIDEADWRSEESKNIPFLKQQIDTTNWDPRVIKPADMVFSFNTFEHIPNPEQALINLHSMLKPNGLVYLSFGPLYNSAWGLHLYRTFYMPFSQFLFSPDFISKTIEDKKITDLGQELESPQYLNQFSLKQYRELFKQSRYFRPVFYKEHKSYNEINELFKYRNIIRSHSLTLEELTTYAIEVVLQKI